MKHGDFERPSKSTESLQCRDRVPVLYARNVVSKQTCPLLHVHLRKRLVFAQCTQSLANDHFGYLETWRVVGQMCTGFRSNSNAGMEGFASVARDWMWAICKCCSQSGWQTMTLADNLPSSVS